MLSSSLPAAATASGLVSIAVSLDFGDRRSAGVFGSSLGGGSAVAVAGLARGSAPGFGSVIFFAVGPTVAGGAGTGTVVTFFCFAFSARAFWRSSASSALRLARESRQA